MLRRYQRRSLVRNHKIPMKNETRVEVSISLVSRLFLFTRLKNCKQGACSHNYLKLLKFAFFPVYVYIITQTYT